RVLHRHAGVAAEQVPEPRLQLLPAEIDLLRAGQMVERPRLDPVDQLARLAPGGDHTIQPSRAHGLVVQVEHAPGQHVAAPEVVEQPAIEVEAAQGRLDRSEVEHESEGSLLRFPGPAWDPMTMASGAAEVNKSAGETDWRAGRDVAQSGSRSTEA